MEDIRLTESEYDEIIEAQNMNNSVKIENEVKTYLNALCEGHVGLIKRSLYLIQKKFKEETDEDSIISYLESWIYRNDVAENRSVATAKLTQEQNHILNILFSAICRHLLKIQSKKKLQKILLCWGI